MTDGRAMTRPERLESPPPARDVVLQPLGFMARAWNNGGIRKLAVILLLMGVWEGYARWLDDPLLFPTFTSTLGALVSGTASGQIPRAAAFTLGLLLRGYLLGLVLAGLLVACAVASRLGSDLLETLSAMFNPLPSVALLPLALIWFGLGNSGVIFVIVHAVLWAVALNTLAGVKGLSPTLRMVGQNYGLSTAGFIARVLIPGAFPSLLTGAKVGWAFAWRTLIAAELVFGVTSGSGGLGWYIYEQKNLLRIPEVFAGLLTVTVFGLFVEHVLFRTIEQRTVRRWGMQQA
ncbi:MAG: ABC transporter permease [Vicinamibacterales bacterium]